MQTAEEISNMD